MNYFDGPAGPSPVPSASAMKNTIKHLESITVEDGQKVLRLTSERSMRTGKMDTPAGSMRAITRADVVYLDGKMIKNRDGSLAPQPLPVSAVPSWLERMLPASILKRKKT